MFVDLLIIALLVSAALLVIEGICALGVVFVIAGVEGIRKWRGR